MIRQNKCSMLGFLKKHKKTIVKFSLLMSAFFISCMALTTNAFAEGESDNLICIGISAGDGTDMASVLQMLLVLTVISLAPSILIMLTSFTRIVIVMHFTRAAISGDSRFVFIFDLFYYVAYI